ncbi:MAG: helix-turn-helix domain-containing protein [Gammaproteobacteria bacterium]|nr:helix-turn-helix domain-containing protein [Gammaproteobacteria bacterium]
MDNNDIGNRLKAARKAAGYKTAFAFCEKFQIPRSTYSQYETGKRIPKTKIIAVYAEKLGVNPRWLKLGEGEPLTGTSYKKSPLEESMQQVSMVEEIINKRYSIDSLDEVLLADLLTEMIARGKKSGLTERQMAYAITRLYSSLRRSVDAPEIRGQMIKVAIDTYFEFFSEK